MTETGTTTGTTDLGGKEAHNDRLKVLMDITLLNSSIAGEAVSLVVPWKEAWSAVHPVKEVTAVHVKGMTELQNEQACDECKSVFPVGHHVAGKVVILEGTSSFFWPTCIPCFVSEQGGYLSASIVALVMKT